MSLVTIAVTINGFHQDFASTGSKEVSSSAVTCYGDLLSALLGGMLRLMFCRDVQKCISLCCLTLRNVGEHLFYHAQR